MLNFALFQDNGVNNDTGYNVSAAVTLFKQENNQIAIVNSSQLFNVVFSQDKIS